MKKLSLDALKERAEATASNELLETISGGTENSCHVHISCDDCSVTNKGGVIIVNPNPTKK